MTNNIALFRKATIFCCILGISLLFNGVAIVYGAPSLLNQAADHLRSPQTLQASDDAAGQWSSVSNLMSSGGYSRNDQDTRIQSAQTDAQQKTSSSASNQNKNINAFVSEAQFLQLQQLVIQINKSVNQLQQQLNTNISELKQENYRLAERVQNLEMIARLLNVELHSLKKTQSAPSTHNNNQVTPNTSNMFFKEKYQQISTYLANQSKFFWMTLIALFILIFLFIKLFMRSHTKESSKKNQQADHSEEEGEYDFMNTKDAIPAKFDLANAYIQMGNAKEAEHVLTDIIKVGTDEEKKKAEFLLQKIQKKE